MTRPTTVLSLACLSLIALSVPGWASAAPAPAPADIPFDISGDKADYDSQAGVVTYKGDVEAVQNGRRLMSDVLNLYLSKDSKAGGAQASAGAKAAAKPSSQVSRSGDFEKIVVDGHVFFTAADQSVAGDHGVYDAALDTVTVTGNVVLVQGDNVVAGSKVIVHLADNHAEIESLAQGRSIPGRVRGVFYNSSNVPRLATGQ